MQYRQADPADIPALAQLRTGREEEGGGASQERMARYMAGEHHPQQALPPRVIYVAVDGEAPVGYIAGHLTRRYACDGELQWIYILPDYRGAGVAAELLRRLAAWFAEQNAARICVNVEPDNTPAIRFYTRHGAEPLHPYWRVWPDIRVVLTDP